LPRSMDGELALLAARDFEENASLVRTEVATTEQRKLLFTSFLQRRSLRHADEGQAKP